MKSTSLHGALATLYSELANGAVNDGGAFVLNSGDAGLLRSLDKLSADDASQTSHAGATIAAHAEHVRYGLSLMNAWARQGGNPFATADWSRAWETAVVTDAEWGGIRRGLREESDAWLAQIETPREMSDIELTGMIGSIAHLAYHLGAMRQISRGARGPRELGR